MAKFYIYYLMAPDNEGKIPRYIGKGQKERMYQHVKDVENGRIPNKNNWPLYYWIKNILDSGKQIKYKKTLQTNDEKLAYTTEKKEIAYWRGIEGCNLLNITDGGDGFSSGENNPMFGKTFSKEHRQKLSEASKKRIYKTGKKHTEESKLKISKANKGRKFTKEHKQKMSEANKGRKHTEEAKRKISETSRGRKHTEEAKRKISEAHMGFKHTEETKRKMSKAKRGKNHPMYRRRGENTNSSKLRDLDIPIIRRLYNDTDLTLEQVGNLFDVSPKCIHRVVKFKTWSHVK